MKKKSLSSDLNKKERHQGENKIGLKQNMRSFPWKMPL
jgi:hypothetical protein